MLRVEFSNLVRFGHVEGTNLDYLLIQLVLQVAALHVTLIAVADLLFENRESYQVEDWNDIGRVVFKFPVKRGVEFMQMCAINIEHILLRFCNLLQLCDIVRLNVERVIVLHVVSVGHNRESQQEFSELCLQLIGVYVRSPQHLCIR